MACKQCEVVCSETFYKEYDPDLSCIHIIEKNGAVKTNVCVQCGKCAKSCEQEAITKNAKGVFTIDGIRMDVDEKDLPAGLYIIDGKKIIKK